MSAFVSNTVNHRAVIGKLKRFDEGIRRLFEQAIMPQDSSQNLFEGFTGEPLDRREIQTYSEWKVQGCFRNLSRRQRKRTKQRIIYILPIGPFPEAIWKPVEGMETSVFQLIANFVGIFFLGMRVKIMDQILVTEMNCKRRIHAVTGKLQLLVSGRHRYTVSVCSLLSSYTIIFHFSCCCTLLQYFTLYCDKLLTTFSMTFFSTGQSNPSIGHDNSTLPSSCSNIVR